MHIKDAVAGLRDSVLVATGLGIILFIVIASWKMERWINWKFSYSNLVEERLEKIEQRLTELEQK